VRDRDAHMPIMPSRVHRSSCRYLGSVLPTIAGYATGVWNTRLLRPITLEDGTTIRTLADARDVILQRPEKEIRKPQWKAPAGLLLMRPQLDNSTCFLS